MIEKAGVDAEVARMSALKSVYLGERQKSRWNIRCTTDALEYQRKLIAALSLDLENLGDASVVEVGGQRYADAELAGKAIMKVLAQAAEQAKAGLRRLELLKIGNGTLSYVNYGLKSLHLRVSDMVYEVELPYGAEKIAVALQERSIQAQLHQQRDRALARAEDCARRLAALERQLQRPFEHDIALENALARQAAIDARLQIDTQDQSLVALEDA